MEHMYIDVEATGIICDVIKQNESEVGSVMLLVSEV